MKRKLLLADDDPIVRDVLREMFASSDRFALVAEAVDGHDAIRQVIQTKPDILLLDLLLPQLPGIETLRELTTVTVPVRTVLLCSAITKRQIVEALQLGARGVILKNSTADLMRALDVVMAGEYWLDGKSVSNIVKTLDELSGEDPSTPDQRELMGLTKRELDIVSLVAEGCQNKDIATRLGIAEDTVKRHLTNIFNKVGTSTRLELALFAVDRHLVARRPDGSSRRPQSN
jgi:two-component system, NarL family, nitrate/nitrite response regulator NarL